MLANTSYAALAALDDADDCLNLAWTLDEQAFFSPPLEQEVGAVLGQAAPFADRYLVDDPYGERTFGPAVCGHFGIAPGSCAVSCGAGVNALLHALAHEAMGGTAYIIGNVYPDFPHWTGRLGGRCVAGEADSAAIGRSGAAVVLLERPALCGPSLGLDTLRGLCLALQGAGVLVVVDESNANYCPPGASAAALVMECHNLVVLRGLTKAFHLGGLRLGYAITSCALAARVRAHMVPLQSASLSLQVGRLILAQGDRCRLLRQRIAQASAHMLALLAASSFPLTCRASGPAPYVFCADPDGLGRDWMARRGIQGKLQPFWMGALGDIGYLYRLSVPLSAARMARFEQKAGLT